MQYLQFLFRLLIVEELNIWRKNINAKPITYGIIGLVSGILLAYLFGMGGRWGMMNGEMHDRGENYNRLEYSGNN